MRILLSTLVSIILANAAFGQSTTLIQDDFSAINHGWLIDDSNFLKDGMYFLKCEEEESESFINFFIDPRKDFELTTDFILQNGAEESAFGLSWATGGDYYNVFLVSPAGEFVVYGGTLNQLKGWKKSMGIRPGGQVNQLQIKGTATQISFFINGQKVEERKPMVAYGNYSGILLLSKVQLTVDNFTFKQNQEIKFRPDYMKFEKKENLGAGVNSPGDELGPVISADGKTILSSLSPTRTDRFHLFLHHKIHCLFPWH